MLRFTYLEKLFVMGCVSQQLNEVLLVINSCG